jgi:[amino group carrier protein]-L-2-aminoadipate/L-glutamate 6-kinase
VLTVIKCGGGIGQDPVHASPDVAVLTARGDRVLLLHGGSAQVDRLAGRLGVPQRRLRTPAGTSSRYTDPATLEVLLLALAGQVKPRLLADLHRHGVSAVGLTGIDAGILRARRRSVHRARLDGRTVVVRDDQTGTLASVRTAPLHALLDAGLVPVLSPPALAEDGEPVNVDADRAAAAVAVALGADNLIFLTGAPGLLADPDDETSVLTDYRLTGGAARIAGGMAVKLKAAEAALRGGVARVLVADGRERRPVLRALDDGSATRLWLGVPAAAVPAVPPRSEGTPR